MTGFEGNVLMQVLFVLYLIIMGSVSIGLPVLYFWGIYKKKYIIEAELLSWSHDKYSSALSCTIKITNLSKLTFLLKEICVKPAFASSAFSKKKYTGELENKNQIGDFPISFSMLTKRKLQVTFPIDLSNLYDIDRGRKAAKKPWALILKTNRLPRRFIVSSPF